MRRSLARRAPLAALLLALPVLLSAPGRGSDAAEDAQASEAMACEVDPAAGSVAQRGLQRLAAQAPNPDVVVLNGRGYNYGSTPEERIEKLKLQALEAVSEAPAKVR